MSDKSITHESSIKLPIIKGNMKLKVSKLNSAKTKVVFEITQNDKKHFVEFSIGYYKTHGFNTKTGVKRSGYYAFATLDKKIRDFVKIVSYKVLSEDGL